MGIDGVIEPIYFLITSFGFAILSFINYRKSGKTLETIFGSAGNEFKPCLIQKAPKSLKSDL